MNTDQSCDSFSLEGDDEVIYYKKRDPRWIILNNPLINISYEDSFSLEGDEELMEEF